MEKNLWKNFMQKENKSFVETQNKSKSFTFVYLKNLM